MGRIRLNEPPTEKQAQFANAIAELLEIELPELKTKITYSDFISENIDAYRELNSELGDEYPWFEELGG